MYLGALIDTLRAPPLLEYAHDFRFDRRSSSNPGAAPAIARVVELGNQCDRFSGRFGCHAIPRRFWRSRDERDQERGTHASNSSDRHVVRYQISVIRSSKACALHLSTAHASLKPSCLATQSLQIADSNSFS